ncbi:seryl-tRNA synthetase [Enterocytozoon bieneusi H348]|nr:seryl-tRNA synthetase [Enterocytozoon bieneusi H348]|eukprot:XP_002649977.1 seryl-tRNA synthetase [Enterocytozoon bieneusi H348]
MIDINLFRTPEGIEQVKKSEKNRFKDVSVVDKIVEMDLERIKTQYEYEQICKRINYNLKQIGQNMKVANSPSEKEEILSKYNTIEEKKERDRLLKKLEMLESSIHEKLNGIGNILDEEVPVHETEDGNKVVREFQCGELPIKIQSFSQLMSAFINSEAGTRACGHRGYFLEGQMALLANGLRNYAIDFLCSRGYVLIQTPVMLKKEVMKQTAQLSDFDEQLYHISDDNMYLIATSEQPLTTLFMEKRFTDSELPKMYAGESLCFRKEAGAHGKDNAGIFRVHQFEKIEQFIICKPEESYAYHEKMILLAEDFYKTLEIPFRTVLIASGEMNDAASKKYDLEAWFPNAQKYRELVSASNCTDYQSRNLNVYYGYSKKNEKPQYVHMLNATLCAVQRTLCCLVENYQDANGKIRIPKVLQKYLNFEYI